MQKAKAKATILQIISNNSQTQHKVYVATVNEQLKNAQLNTSQIKEINILIKSYHNKKQLPEQKKALDLIKNKVDEILNQQAKKEQEKKEQENEEMMNHVNNSSFSYQQQNNVVKQNDLLATIIEDLNGEQEENEDQDQVNLKDSKKNFKTLEKNNNDGTFIDESYLIDNEDITFLLAELNDQDRDDQDRKCLLSESDDDGAKHLQEIKNLYDTLSSDIIYFQDRIVTLKEGQALDMPLIIEELLTIKQNLESKVNQFQYNKEEREKFEREKFEREEKLCAAIKQQSSNIQSIKEIFLRADELEDTDDDASYKSNLKSESGVDKNNHSFVTTSNSPPLIYDKFNQKKKSTTTTTNKHTNESKSNSK